MRTSRCSRVILLSLVMVVATGVAVPASASAAACQAPAGQALGATSWAAPNSGSWDDASKWSNGLPNPSCTTSITVAGTYTVTLPAGGLSSGITLGGSSGTQTLQIAGSTQLDGSPQESDLNPSYSGNSFTIGSRGVVQLTSSGTNPGAAILSGSVVNSGLIRTDPGAPGPNTRRDLRANVTNNPTGAVAMHTDMDTCGCGGTHTWINNGTITTDAGTKSIFTGTAAGVLFSQSTGTFVNNGRAEIAGGFTNSGTGASSGNPIEICGYLDAPGTGASKFEFDSLPDLTCTGGSGQLTGDIGSATSVLVHNSGGSLGVTVPTNITNRGTLTLDGGPGDNQLVGSGAVSNVGTLNLNADPAAGATLITTPLTNTGAINLAAGSNAYSSSSSGSTRLTQAGGTFTLGAGASFSTNGSVDLTGGTIANAGSFASNGGAVKHTGGGTTGNPISLCNGTLNATGPGSAKFDVAGSAACGGASFGSDVGPGDAVRLHTDLSRSNIDVYAPSSFTNHGSITFDSPAGTQVQLHGTGSFRTMTNAGTLNFTGPTTSVYLALTNQGTMNVPAGGHVGVQPMVTEAAGTLSVDGALDVSGSLPVTGGTLRGTGTINAPSGVNNTGGTVHPGHSPGILSITGDYTQGSGGTLALDVAGPTPGTGYSRLAVSGAASLAGTLHVTTTSPQPSTGLRVLTAASRTGAFAPVTFTGQAGDVSYDATGVTLSPTTLSPTPQATSTTVSCSPSSFTVGHTTTCVARVTDTAASSSHPAGTVNFTSTGAGVFGSGGACTLAPTTGAGAASCSVSYKPTKSGTPRVTATFAGTAERAGSSGSTTVTAKALITCRVPKLKGKTLSQAKKILSKAHCALGKVRKPRHPHGTLVVSSQSPKAGSVRSKGARVGVTLAVRRRHH